MFGGMKGIQQSVFEVVKSTSKKKEDYTPSPLNIDKVKLQATGKRK